MNEEATERGRLRELLFDGVAAPPDPDAMLERTFSGAGDDGAHLLPPQDLFDEPDAPEPEPDEDAVPDEEYAVEPTEDATAWSESVPADDPAVDGMDPGTDPGDPGSW